MQNSEAMLVAAVILKGVITGTLLHILLPLLLWIAYRGLVWRVKREQIIQAPINDLAFVFATYGGLLYVVVTVLFWSGSGIFYIVTFCLILGGPIAMGYIAYKNRRRKAYSKYHLWTYRLELFYMIVPMTILLYVVLKN